MKDVVIGGMFARRAAFLLSIPTSAPDLPSHGEAPQVDHVALHTQHTHFRLILCLILCGGRFALVSPNMRRDMLPWSVGDVTDLPPDAKLCKTQQREGNHIKEQ